MILGTVFVLITGLSLSFILDLVGSKLHTRTDFSDKRIHLGTHEAGLFSHASLRVFSEPPAYGRLSLYHQRSACWHFTRDFSDPGSFLQLFRYFGKHFLWLDIAVFALSVILAFGASYRLTLSCRAKNYGNLFGLLVFVVLLCFLFFTYHAPALGLFTDPTKQF